MRGWRGCSLPQASTASASFRSVTVAKRQEFQHSDPEVTTRRIKLRTSLRGGDLHDLCDNGGSYRDPE